MWTRALYFSFEGEARAVVWSNALTISSAIPQNLPYWIKEAAELDALTALHGPSELWVESELNLGPPSGYGTSPVLTSIPGEESV